MATRSDRDREPVLICRDDVATARSAMVVSSVSPERWDMTVVYPAFRAISIAARVSVRVPIWLTLTRIEFAAPVSMPCCRTAVWVTNKSSPTSCTRSPNRAVSARQPSQSSSAIPSSMVMIG